MAASAGIRDSDGLDRLDRVVVQVATWCAGIFFTILVGVALATARPAVLVQAAAPGVVGAVGLLMLLRGTPRVLVHMAVGAAMVAFYVSFADTDARSNALVGLVSMGISGALFVRRRRALYVIVVFAAIVAASMWWSPPDVTAGKRMLAAVSPALLFAFTAGLLMWLKRELERGRARYKTLFERYRSLFEAAPIGTWVLDVSALIPRVQRLRRAGVTDLRRYLAQHPRFLDAAFGRVRIMNANRAAVDLLDADTQEQAVSEGARLNKDGAKQALGAHLVAMWEGSTEAQTEIEGTSLTGRHFSAALKTAMPLADPRHVIVSSVDITERKASDRRQQALLASKDEFVAAVSHELRTPLTSVVGLSEELRNRKASFTECEVDEFIGMIADQSLEVAHIVEDLLVIADGNERHLTLRLADVSLPEELARVLDAGGSLRPLTAQIQADVPVLADGARVRQILRNLVLNAQRYGGASIRVVIGADDHFGFIEVRDSGSPLPAAVRDSIFEPYYRAHSHDGLTASVGLGLTVSRQLARLMGGDLRYDHDGDESLFRLTLPAAAFAASGPSPPAAFEASR